MSVTALCVSSERIDYTAWNRSKIMLVGQGRAGKTALARSMMGEPFKETPSTIGGKLFEREIREGSVKGGKLAEHKRPEKELEWMVAKQGMQFSNELKERKKRAKQIQNVISNGIACSAYEESPAGTVATPHVLLEDSWMTPILKREETQTKNQFTANVNKTGIKWNDVDEEAMYKCFSENMNGHRHLSKLTISLCDFGGQEVFNALHAFFMTRCGVYLLVFDMELFLSKDEKDRESCHENIKFWMNSIAMHTYDEKTEKTAPVALVGTRRDKISNMEVHDKISAELEEKYGKHRVWPSLIHFHRDGKNKLFRSREPNALNYFPIDNKKRLLESTTLTQLLQNVETIIMESEEVKREIPVIWMKALDQIREKRKANECSFLWFHEVSKIGRKLGISLEGVSELLRYFYEMGVLIWIEEPGLREIVILDPMEYFVKPVTRIICKHLASKKDPYATKHELSVHKQCQRELSEDWKLMLEFGMVSDQLARRLLAGDREGEESVERILSLMSMYGLMIPLRGQEDPTLNCEATEMPMYFVPSLVPANPESIVISENSSDEKKLLSRLRQRFLSLTRFPSSFTVFLAFSLPTTSNSSFQLFSYDEVETNGFLPNGLFDRFIARILSNLPDLVMKSHDTRFIAFKDLMRIDCNGKLIRLTNHFHQNMIKMEIEEGNSVSDLRELVEEWLEVAKKLIRECYKCLEVTVLLPVECEEGKNGLVSLEGLLNTNQQNVMPEYISEDGLCRLSRAKFIELQSKWSSVVPVPPVPLDTSLSIPPLVNPTNPSHIMFSYCWGYKKDHVVAMEKKLREKGYDIWRDENGSSIVPPLAGDTDESMARAVEKSSLIIVFVSKAYFSSVNCKIEAQYCRQKRKPLLFVMLDENYHTSSSPEAVEGWLGLLIGTQLWYALWNVDQQLESTSSAIANLIGNISLLSQSQQVLGVTPPPAPLP
jgi:GTPase SAR1 family protein